MFISNIIYYAKIVFTLTYTIFFILFCKSRFHILRLLIDYFVEVNSVHPDYQPQIILYIKLKTDLFPHFEYAPLS